ncbi:putative signal-transduction protein [Hoeflea phototrophica DFL-43]|jgi:CBS domain-containing protein|uniref:Putative signal-transduction protein n=1 Tax=Hoeflea phototrophica (strain DSM 17068 / NCIMB 14078 / DFL-43) TaxID=411684 RepID=A9D9U0_HOEPD|nr:CBS domain-containing protein [Hoeflea phototrophica]EDQ32984.1 putative signal-transduction protein [Hoeflea phototrophica DFL-43]
MTVKHILDEKGREVVTVSPSMGTADAVRFLADNKIGAVVVTGAGGKIAGILSERDIVRAIASRGADALSAPIYDIMTSKVTTCGESHTVNQVMELMTKGRFRHLPVEADGKLIGIISIGDVVRRRIEDVEREAEEIKAYIAS